MKQRLAILVSGRGSNMVALVRHCREGALAGLAEPVVVASNDPEAQGLATAETMGIPAVAVSSKGRRRATFDRLMVEALRPHKPDWIVLAGFMRILTPAFLQAFPGRVVNIHPADSRAYQGAHGYEWAREEGLDTTFITVHYVDEGMDTGPIIAQAPVDLRGAADLDEVRRRGLAVEHRFYAETIKKLFTGEGG